MPGRLFAATLLITGCFAIGAHPAVAAPIGCDDNAVAIDTVYLPNVTKTLGGEDGWGTPFIVQNVGSEETTIDVHFYRFSDGELVVCRRISGIKPGTSYADIPNDDNDLPDGTQFSVVVRSIFSAVVSVVNQSRGTGASTQSASYTGTTVGARRVYLPNVTKRFFGYGVPFIVQNLGAGDTSVTANFTSFDGSDQANVTRYVRPGRSTVFDPDQIGALHDGRQYSVVVTSDQPVAVVANAHNESVGPVAYAHNGLTLGSPLLYAPYIAKSAPGLPGRDSPIVVQNVSPEPVEARLEFTQLATTTPETTTQSFLLRDIAPLTARVFDPRFTLETTSPCTGPVLEKCLGPGEYSLTIRASGAVAAVVTPTDRVSAAAYVAQPFTAVRPRVSLPNITRNLGGAKGWTTPIVLQSADATNAVMRWYRFSDGQLVVATTRRLVAGTSVWIDPREVSGLEDGGQYSLVIEGEVPGGRGRLTAIVYELATGGDSAMIYEGFPSG